MRPFLPSLLLFWTIFSIASCKQHTSNHEGHDANHKGHNLVLLPYNKNVDFFDKSQQDKTWKHRFCVHKDVSLKYIPCLFNNTLRPMINTLQDSFINVPFYDPETTVSSKFKVKIPDNTELDADVGVIPRLGFLGCNYFLAGGPESPFNKSNLSANPMERNNCHLDSFHVQNQIYIHLLTVQHDSNGEVPDMIQNLINYDFPISLQDYKKLDKILTKNKYVGGGFNNSDLKPLYIHIDNNGPIDSIFPVEKVTHKPQFMRPIYTSVLKSPN